jgi:sn-glycerol 3-phosphate transport system substrate-binding protein
MKKIAFLLVALILVVSLVPGHTETGLSSAQENVEIVFVHTFGDENDIRQQVVQALADEFMAEHDNVTVEIRTGADYDEIFETTLLAAEQGDPPHVVQLDEGATRRAIDSDRFVKITDMATEEQLAAIDGYIEPVLNFYLIEDEMWSLPWNSSNPVLYYNKTMFETAGLDPNSPPATFDEMLSACEAIMNSELELEGCVNWPLTSWFPENWIAMQGALLVNNGNGREGRPTETFINSPEMLNVVEWWGEMADQGYYKYTGVRADYVGEAGAFITQQFAMHINSTAGISNFQYYADLLRYNLGVAPLPLPNPDADLGTVNGGGSLWLTDGHPTAEMEAARDFMFFMTNDENIAEWHKATGYFPNRTGSVEMVEAEGFWEENPAYFVAVEQMLETEPTLATAGAVIGPHAQVRTFIDQAVQSVIDGGEDPAEALDAAKVQADRALEDYNRFFEEQ